MTETPHNFPDALDFFEFYEGTVVAEGYAKPLFFRPVRFRTILTGKWQNDTFILHENMQSEDGGVVDRTWHMTVVTESLIHARADDVPKLIEGHIDGATFTWKYPQVLAHLNQQDGDTPSLAEKYPLLWKLFSPLGTVIVDEFQIRTSPTALVELTLFKKFGITLGKAYSSFQKATEK